ncbi:hypothetical protein HWQ46_07160 [Shewanella sp. D64]|uniref:hypothetical protein n=1 Tax=unclassified Shewanella TaxID=196818 RepID=UPI0022BA5A84|nr:MULTISPECIES: hypothetical protein [unclassified Shewanella]MEC4725322.1 hypothetical protein [Shewanella sp. D64]MEC4735832.1 hypothetical protein [Shewanella sp. E94]WBJ93197.1 hypothetical protein HWQ47_14660 [Shewanella sp. MTB7]
MTAKQATRTGIEMHCGSCGMVIDHEGEYCQYCVDDNGSLKPYEEVFAKMERWLARVEPTLSLEQIAQKTRNYMATMPAWRGRDEI